jgi:hypothetical protein
MVSFLSLQLYDYLKMNLLEKPFRAEKIVSEYLEWGEPNGENPQVGS